MTIEKITMKVAQVVNKVSVVANLILTHVVEIMLEVGVLSASIRVVKVVYEDLKERGITQTIWDLLMPIVFATEEILIRGEISVFVVSIVL